MWQRLTALRFCLIGAGRTGSLVAMTLIRQGVQYLTLIDPDVVEQPNLDAMDAVTERDLGQSKVAALAEHLGHDLPHARITALPQSIMTIEARELAKSADVLVCCVDDDVARLVSGALACCYTKPLLDIGTGVFHHQHATPQVYFSDQTTPQSLRPRRVLGADVRLILPHDGCLLCWGGVADPQAAFQRWRSSQPRRPWHAERAGSLRSLNAIAAHLGVRLLEDLIAGQLTRSVWCRFEMDEHGLPSLQHLPLRRRSSCPLCARQGIGDLLGR